MRVEEHTIELAEAPVFYRTADAESILYLHGVPTSSDDWPAFLERTGGLAPDLIGFGRSAKGGHLDYTPHGLEQFVERFLAALSLDQVSLVGHDWGATIALLFAQRHPDRIDRLVVIDPVPLLDGFRWGRAARIWRRPVVGELAMGSTTRWVFDRSMRRGCLRPDAWPRERLTALWEQFDQGTQRAILRLYRAAPEQWLAQAGAGLHSIRSPALVLWGEADPWIPVALGEQLVGRLPDARLERIGEAGHWPWLEQPAVLDRVAAFLTG